MWLVGVVSRRLVWLVGVGGIYGCDYIVGVVLKRYIDFLILLIPTPLVFVLFCCSFFFYKCFSFLFQYFFVIKLCIK